MASLRTTKLLLAIACLSLAGRSQNSPSPNPVQTDGDRHKLVQVAGFEVTGTRLPKDSLIRISGLKVGQMVNDDVLLEASHKITSTGLVSMVDFAYKASDGNPAVVLSLKVYDEQPLLPIQIYPHENEERMWACLQSGDPIFTREMPNTRDALHFYSVNIDRCLANGGSRSDFYTSPTVACDANGKAAVIVFNIRERNASARK
ncbi:MAG: hypothetical protein WB992_14155 [Bryobacteraceae bacterium]